MYVMSFLNFVHNFLQIKISDPYLDLQMLNNYSNNYLEDSFMIRQKNHKINANMQSYSYIFL